MKKVRLEVWKCDNKEEEIHVFDGTRYVFGWNPKLIDKAWIKLLLKLWNYELSKK